MAQPLPLPIWDRQAGKLIEEFMEDHPSTYESRPRHSLTQWLELEPLYDWLLAAYQNTRRSARQIEPFIRKHNIDMSEFQPVVYRSFGEFFDREFRPGIGRSWPRRTRWPLSPRRGISAGRDWKPTSSFPSRGTRSLPEKILGNEERAAPFIGGPVLLARLSPMDYHHVHYPDDGMTLDIARLGHSLWTVNWHALQNQPDILFRNERQIDILETKNFGRLAFVEVGAMSVGRIVRIHPRETAFQRGEEKSVFKFGGSAIVVFGEQGKWCPVADILQHTAQSIETLIKLGDSIGLRATQS